MIVFSNTTPIIALSSIQQLDLLPELFGQLHLVNEVETQRGIELLNGHRIPLISVVVSDKIDVRNFDASTL